MRNYKFNNELNFLEIRTEGNLMIDDIVNHYESIANDDSLPRKLKVLIDCSKTQLNVQPDDINYSQITFQNTLEKFEHIKEAILVDQPYETVIATLFENLTTGLDNYNFKIFCTENAAINWLIQ